MINNKIHSPMIEEKISTTLLQDPKSFNDLGLSEKKRLALERYCPPLNISPKDVLYIIHIT